ncbi:MULTISPECIES: 23S rRNA (adenine(2030)-N(6))-methyltransferase RlmJ [unclassified Bradyrhizobium]|uniref:23S rRNA (adenine(2030)-N(6))-methyltransferase RlmJ n=1 Tax=unclassified Bradyrhizobium TaxID=2631580 RepID=UPI002478F615|nr:MULTISPECIES: 23S rRNA (adenine(2030)-N(6))-methyltransferase RlmJ [unclassified Bradyrhizobium]WGR72878.1 23S rRNA (adenine(2030)-N(6))-methyltransferase RlmJ [Bradyrhizobium sp. ISRA426]WGR77713.1 23S rRNA (adenine(2030)-N(6))-methyltransferase RlmJ [Bradyrhizobium sp. ISRA430]WGR88118.1 23S rRNA (adenine(2030)-N(6))-methyltransferase RlmJ [Bradyrhizobium sp. ISRA432]
MNYRHDFHAGNHSEVFKHALLCALIDHLQLKPKPICVVDTHAGSGLYDLESPEAMRTGEADRGIRLVYPKRTRALQRYLGVIEHFNPDGLKVYPGSPAIIRHLLRSEDRLVACELEARAAARLKEAMEGDGRVGVHQREGFAAVHTFVPPKERRGLVFLDPPFEKPDELSLAAAALNAAFRKWPTGTYALWYPITGRSQIAKFKKLLIEAVPTFCVEFLAYAKSREGLIGSGLVICNPPWQFEKNVHAICKALVPVFEECGSGYSTEWWVRPR